MGKPIVVKPDVVATLPQKGFNIGLVLGQRSEKKDIVVQFVFTDTDSGSGDGAQTIDTFDESSLSQQADSVADMLPGGISILGLIIVGPEDVLSDRKYSTKIKSLANQISTGIKSKSNRALMPSTPVHIGYVNTGTKKFTGKCMDSNSALTPVTWKVQDDSAEWIEIKTRYDVARIGRLLLPSTSKSFKSILEKLMNYHKGIIERSICTLNGKLNSSDDLSETISSAFPKSESEDMQPIRATLLSNEVMSVFDLGENGEKTGVIKFKGVVCGSALMHESSTLGEAVEAVKEDLFRSLGVRLKMHLESIEEDDFDPSVLQILPKRVPITVPNSLIHFSEYLFPDDTPEELLPEIEKKIGSQITLGSLDLDYEKFPDNNVELEEPVVVTTKPDKKQGTDQPSSNLLVYGIIVAFVILIASIIIQLQK